MTIQLYLTISDYHYFVLTRDVNRFYTLYNDAVLESLNEFGFNKAINKPLVMNQTDCTLARP